MQINLPLPTIILILYIVYVIFSLIMKKIKFNAENLEELDGEFIFTFIPKIKKQEIYFNIIRNKDEMRIYTIDGFTNRIFKNTIAPFFGIYNFETIDEEDEEFYGNILGQILENEEYFEKFLFLVEEKKEKVYNVNTHKKTAVRSEIDLRGKMVDEGIYELETYLDRATLNGYTEVYVIHGKGTGALREGILKYLKTCKYVKEYRIGGHGEGGLGCTVVTLK